MKNHSLNWISWQWKLFQMRKLWYQLTLNQMFIPVFLLHNPSPCSVGGCRGSYHPAGITSTRLSPVDAPPQRSNCEWCAVFPLNSIFPAHGLHCTVTGLTSTPKASGFQFNSPFDDVDRIWLPHMVFTVADEGFSSGISLILSCRWDDIWFRIIYI